MTKKSGFVISSVLFFLMFFAIGVYTPILSLYLKDMLHFSGKQTGLIMSLVLISSLLSPLIGSFIIDRIVSKKWMLFFCSLFSAILLLFLSYFKTYYSFLTTYVLYIIFNSPILGIIIALALEKINNKEKFGNIRLFGTLGWIAASMFFGLFWINSYGYEKLGDSFIIASLSFFCFAIFALTMKDNKPNKEAIKIDKKNVIRSIVPIGVIKYLLKPELRIMLILYCIGYILESINIFGASPFLKQIGFDKSLIMPIQTMGQVIEIVSLFSISYLLLKLGKKSIFRISLVCQLLALILFAFFGHIKILIYVGLILQGIKIGLLIPVITIYIDTHCDAENRGAVHQLLSLIFGISYFIGNNVSGWIMDFATDNNSVINFSIFWFVPLFITTIGLFLMEFFFTDHIKQQKNMAPSPAIIPSKSE